MRGGNPVGFQVKDGRKRHRSCRSVTDQVVKKRHTQRMMIDKVLAPALFLLPKSGNSCVDQGLNGVIQLELLGQSGSLQLDSAFRTEGSTTFHAL